MSGGIRTLVALDTGVARDTIERVFPSGPPVELVGVIEGLEESWNALQETATDLVVVACVGYSDRALFFIESAIKQNQDRPVVVLAVGAPNGFVRRVFETGADDILTLPDSSDEIAFALQKAIARRQGAAVASGIALAPMICVLGPKGGTGKTITSSNLTVGLADAGKRSVLVDIDLQFGDAGLALGLAPDKTIYDLVRSGGSLDAEKLDAYLQTHSSGARVLMAPTRPDQATSITVEFLREVYATLRSTFDYVIVDTPPGFTPEVIASIDNSTSVVLVGMLDSLSLKNMKLGLETLELMGYERERISVLLNRADSRIGISREDVEAILGRRPDVLVPSNREIARSVTEGAPIVLSDPRSEAARAFRTLAEVYLNANGAGPKAESEQDPKRRRLLHLWRR